MEDDNGGGNAKDGYGDWEIDFEDDIGDGEAKDGYGDL